MPPGPPRATAAERPAQGLQQAGETHQERVVCHRGEAGPHAAADNQRGE